MSFFRYACEFLQVQKRWVHLTRMPLLAHPDEGLEAVVTLKVGEKERGGEGVRVAGRELAAICLYMWRACRFVWMAALRLCMRRARARARARRCACASARAPRLRTMLDQTRLD